MADTEETMALIRECIMHKDPIGVKKMILEDKFKDESQFWELVSLLGEAVTKENFDVYPGFIDVCERCMRYIINVGNPKELVLALLEQADTFSDSVKFQTFLQLIQKSILRLPAKQLFSLEVALETLSDCVAQLELPGSLELEEEESRSQELDPDVEKINQDVSVYLDFIAPFVDQVDLRNATRQMSEEDTIKQRRFLEKYLLKVLGHPILFLDLTIHEGHSGMKVKPTARISSERIVAMLMKLNAGLYSLVDQSLKHSEMVKRKTRSNVTETDQSLEQVSLLSLSCLQYLTIVEEVGERSEPCLMSKQGFLEMNLPFILVLVSRPESEIRKKGVALFQALLPNDGEYVQLCHEDLDRAEYFAILGKMFEIMIHCSVKSLRQTCVQLVPSFIQMFDFEGRYQIFVKLFGTLKHAGALGYCVQLLKKQLEEILASSWTGCKSAHWFCGLNLNRLFLLITSLPEGAATDLVENSDRLISVLNLIRYIVLKDPPKQNMTGFWDFYPSIDKDFLKQLHTGLDMSKGHYSLELEGLEKENTTKASNQEEVEMSVSVAGFKMPKMARGQKIAIMQQAVNTLELVTSLLVRVNELIDQQLKQ